MISCLSIQRWERYGGKAVYLWHACSHCMSRAGGVFGVVSAECLEQWGLLQTVVERQGRFARSHSEPTCRVQAQETPRAKAKVLLHDHTYCCQSQAGWSCIEEEQAVFLFLVNETTDAQAVPHLTHLSRSTQGLQQIEEMGKWLVCCSSWLFPATGTWRPVLLLGKEKRAWKALPGQINQFC